MALEQPVCLMNADAGGAPRNCLLPARLRRNVLHRRRCGTPLALRELCPKREESFQRRLIHHTDEHRLWRCEMTMLNEPSILAVCLPEASRTPDCPECVVTADS